jgi:hypothetical protein
MFKLIISLPVIFFLGSMVGAKAGTCTGGEPGTVGSDWPSSVEYMTVNPGWVWRDLGPVLSQQVFDLLATDANHEPVAVDSVVIAKNDSMTTEIRFVVGIKDNCIAAYFRVPTEKLVEVLMLVKTIDN